MKRLYLPAVVDTRQTVNAKVVETNHATVLSHTAMVNSSMGLLQE